MAEKPRKPQPTKTTFEKTVKDKTGGKGTKIIFTEDTAPILPDDLAKKEQDRKRKDR